MKQQKITFKSLKCRHCNSINFVANCSSCDRLFVLTKSHLEGNIRQAKDESLKELPSDFSLTNCDYCRVKEDKSIGSPIVAGLTQKTCPKCKTEFIS